MTEKYMTGKAALERSRIAFIRSRFFSRLSRNAITAEAPCAMKKANALKICANTSHRYMQLPPFYDDFHRCVFHFLIRKNGTKCSQIATSATDVHAVQNRH